MIVTGGRHRVAHVQGAVGSQVDAVAGAGAVVVGGGTGALEVHLPGLGGLDVEEGVLSEGWAGESQQATRKECEAGFHD